MIPRRSILAAALGLPALSLAPAALAAQLPALTVWKTSTCGCCKGWITHMTRAGYRPKVVLVDDVNPVHRRHGVPFELGSCHLAMVGDYVVVGHVPPADVTRLLKEKPKAVGITVPGMPIGSPGLESRDGRTERYETLLLLPGGKTRVIARHG